MRRMGILREVFGPSQKEVWEALSHKIGGEAKSSFWSGTEVSAAVGEWTVTLDSHTVTTGQTSVPYTRIRAPYVNPNGFRFNIYPAGFLSALGKVLGMQDVEVGQREFDERFIIKGNDEASLRLLFADETVRRLIGEQSTIQLEVRDNADKLFGAKTPADVDILSFEVPEVIKDVERLEALFELFGAVLHQLCNIGSAYETDPKFSLSG